MKITKLMIYGFGKHENLTLDVDKELAVVFGNNEAGKTTIQQFIVQILFGFPSRNQTGSRYEPKSGGKYGGQLFLDDPNFGKVVVERIKGKASGDVTVYFEDGTRGAEAELKKLLRDYDRVSFEAVFSFSIHELQGLDKMTEEQLGRTLLASGTTGVDAITKMEAELEKNMGSLFKKGGRNPSLNLLIEELRSDERELKNHRAQADSYGPYLEKLTDYTNRLTELEGMEKSISGQLAEAAKRKQAEPLAERKKQLEAQVALLTVSHFPAEGSSRMERLSERVSETTAKQKHAERELAELPETIQYDLDGEGIEEMIGREAEWLRFLSRYRDAEEEAEKLNEQLGRELGLSGMELSVASRFDTSLVNEEKLQNLAHEAAREEEDSRFLEREIQEEKRKLMEAEKEMSYLENIAPTPEEMQAAAKWPEDSLKLAEAKAIKRLGAASSNRLLYIVIAVAGAVGILSGILRADLLVIMIASAVAAVAIWMLLKGREKPGAAGDMEDILQRYHGKETEMEMLQQKISEHDRKVEETLRLITRADLRIEELMKSNKSQPARAQYKAYLEELGITSSASSATVIELFRSIRKVQEIQGKLTRVEESLKSFEKEKKHWLEKGTAAAGYKIQAEELFAALRSESKKKQSIDENNQRIAEKREALTQEIRKLTSYLQELETEKAGLLAESRAVDTEHFYRLHLEWLRKKELQQELEMIDNQLKAIGATEPALVNSEQSLSQMIDALEQELAIVKKERNEILSGKAELQQKVNHLLTDEAYELKLQDYEEKKARFNELARHWSVDKAITEAIRRTMTDLKEKSLPAVLTGACEYFRRLTGGNYSGMEIHPDGHFEAVRKDNIRFRIAELSQATKEQAYLALRFSLAVSMQKSHPFPVIMDDPFVHFDRLRLQQVIDLVKELQTNHQFIYFTCHEEMCQAWPEAQVIDVANSGRSVYT